MLILERFVGTCTKSETWIISAETGPSAIEEMGERCKEGPCPRGEEEHHQQSAIPSPLWSSRIDTSCSGLEESFKTDYQDFPVSSTMILRSRFQKPSEVKIRKRQIRCGKNKQKKSTASRIPVDQETTRKYQNLKKSSSKCEAYQHYDRKKCYILTRDSKTLRFDLDEYGHCKISIEDSQSTEDIAWLDIFTSNKLNNCAPVARNGIKRCKNLVTMTQRSKNNFLLLGKNKKQLYLKVLNPNGKTMEGHMVKEDSMEVITGGAPDPRQLTEQDNQLFIMHNNQEDSVRFQCYKDQNYYLHVNKDSVDLCKMEETDGDTGKDFYFKVAYV
ncbi:uncharacterized protein LOC114020138 isoform X3 [Chelonia mydas]|uniref:uncharacterized protein LOC114020138 isoform X3 n=1 Tax=Chelonia mydas TaxID=8469 RepID=UPI0018A21721|nr:uncharacterized protein LOC114020138 isoform X3 [Chelonia mydas]